MRFAHAEPPSAVRLTLGGSDEWALYKVMWNDLEVVVDPAGKGGAPYVPGSGEFWFDGDGASEAATVHKQLVEERERADGLEQALEEARRARGGAGADQGSASPGKAELGGGRELEESRRRIKQLEAQLAASGGGKSSACAVQ